MTCCYYYCCSYLYSTIAQNSMHVIVYVSLRAMFPKDYFPWFLLKVFNCSFPLQVVSDGNSVILDDRAADANLLCLRISASYLIKVSIILSSCYSYISAWFRYLQKYSMVYCTYVNSNLIIWSIQKLYPTEGSVFCSSTGTCRFSGTGSSWLSLSLVGTNTCSILRSHVTFRVSLLVTGKQSHFIQIRNCRQLQLPVFIAWAFLKVHKSKSKW